MSLYLFVKLSIQSNLSQLMVGMVAGMVVEI
ncbi:hypothetical protein FHS90_001399 [Rufibacter quisquiliarum]|uniref:Uncharacterized protein n=1 Tax=Rufibacter quisquiliarum TaxID=1549639 RepID=A0A839GGH7_9BACT|nr:hypothetical protein [Rufibacter quisquiliarum]